MVIDPYLVARGAIFAFLTYGAWRYTKQCQPEGARALSPTDNEGMLRAIAAETSEPPMKVIEPPKKTAAKFNAEGFPSTLTDQTFEIEGKMHKWDDLTPDEKGRAALAFIHSKR